MALFVALSYGQRVDLQPTCDGQVTEARQANGEALDVHLKRQLDEASGAYKRVLSADPPLRYRQIPHRTATATAEDITRKR